MTNLYRKSSLYLYYYTFDNVISMFIYKNKYLFSSNPYISKRDIYHTKSTTIKGFYWIFESSIKYE